MPPNFRVLPGEEEQAEVANLQYFSRLSIPSRLHVNEIHLADKIILVRHAESAGNVDKVR
jgi:hypothetical protein